MQLLENLQEKMEKPELEPGRPMEIVKYDNPLLRTKSEPYVGDIVSDTEMQQLIADMIATMQNANAVGLAAIQVGVPTRILIVQDEKREPHVVINPVVVEEDEEKVHMTEGCLSFPGLFMQVWRPASVVVKCLNMEGKAVTVAADNLLGRAIIHEIDHLDGVLFTDRVPKVLSTQARKKMELHKRHLNAYLKNQKKSQAKIKKLLAERKAKGVAEDKEVVKALLET